MTTILDTIVARTRADLEEARARLPLEELRRQAAAAPPPRDFLAALQSSPAGPKLIAEVKKASPSKGLLCPDFDPVALARTYEANGASAISVLTEPHFFQGSLAHLTAVRSAVAVPVLRKDFIVDPYQVYQARVAGADAILLICALLNDTQLGDLLALAHELGMRCLVEAHDTTETERALESGARIIGINNRDLRTFRVDIRTTRRLRALIPPDHPTPFWWRVLVPPRVVVSESGLHHSDDVATLRLWGVQALLVGEAIVSASDRAAKVRELSPLRVKICGARTPRQALAATEAGADYLGLVFSPTSSRLVTPEQAAAITHTLRQRREAGGHAPKVVGVFVNEPPETINALAQACGLDLAQLSGDESPEVCQAIHVPVIKAVRPRSLADLERLSAYRPGVQAFLLDTPVAGRWGGTGAVGDWSLARELAARHPTLLAGGLTPENVGAAIEAAQPWGVDVSSGVETNGSKDAAKIQAFVAAARGTQR